MFAEPDRFVMTDLSLLPSSPASSGARNVDASLFRLLVDMEMRKAQRLRYCISVICVGARGLAAELSPSGLFLDHFQRQLRTIDAVARWPPASLALLLVNVDASNVSGVMRRITTQLAEDSWRAGGVSYPGANRGADDMLRQAVRLMERALHDPGNRLYLA
jgi:hypothetical protein